MNNITYPMEPIGFHRSWPIFPSIPDGWVRENGCLGAPLGYIAIRNNRSRFDKENKHMIALVPFENLEGKSNE